MLLCVRELKFVKNKNENTNKKRKLIHLMETLVDMKRYRHM
jgi:hypothetical protein